MLLIFEKIVDPGDLWNYICMILILLFGIPADKSPCIKYKHGMYGLQKE